MKSTKRKFEISLRDTEQSNDLNSLKKIEKWRWLKWIQSNKRLPHWLYVSSVERERKNNVEIIDLFRIPIIFVWQILCIFVSRFPRANCEDLLRSWSNRRSHWFRFSIFNSVPISTTCSYSFSLSSCSSIVSLFQIKDNRSGHEHPSIHSDQFPCVRFVNQQKLIFHASDTEIYLIMSTKAAVREREEKKWTVRYT